MCINIIELTELKNNGKINYRIKILCENDIIND
jgi:hypothetical protein